MTNEDLAKALAAYIESLKAKQNGISITYIPPVPEKSRIMQHFEAVAEEAVIIEY